MHLLDGAGHEIRATKSEEQPGIQALHRALHRLVDHRTARLNQMRGLLLDRGYRSPCQPDVRGALSRRPWGPANGLIAMSRELIGDLFEFMGQIDVRITAFDRRIDAVFRSNEDCRRIACICRIGPKTTTAVVAAAGDGRKFKNGGHPAAWMGLGQRRHSGGDKRLGVGTGKRGDRPLRTWLIHGARSVVRVAQRKTDPFNQWVDSLREQRVMNRAIVAGADKNARIIRAMLNRNGEYRAAVQARNKDC